MNISKGTRMLHAQGLDRPSGRSMCAASVTLGVLPLAPRSHDCDLKMYPGRNLQLQHSVYALHRSLTKRSRTLQSEQPRWILDEIQADTTRINRRLKKSCSSRLSIAQLHFRILQRSGCSHCAATIALPLSTMELYS